MAIQATERYAYGWIDTRCRFPSATEAALREAAGTLFRTEAELRGYCMELWDDEIPRGRGAYQYGIFM